jgi:signal transduction histidine kinase
MKPRLSSLDTFGPVKFGMRWVFFVVAVIISVGSILYTNTLVTQIREQEQKQIELYARSLEFLANVEDDPNFILILDEIISSNSTIPVILTDENHRPEQYRNLPIADKETDQDKRRIYLEQKRNEMGAEHQPIMVTLRVSEEVYGAKHIYYQHSALLDQLSYYPYVQLSIIGAFVLVVFLLFNYSRAAEQNRVWVGLAKETAHQLGTPLSSLMAWSEYFKTVSPEQMEAIVELDKDIKSLETITERFSNIGSVPQLRDENVPDVMDEILMYLGKRLSSKIAITTEYFPSRQIPARLNKSLFAWVVENLCKNAADAMEGKGAITIRVMKVNEGIAIDISDTGKGIPKFRTRQVFKPGFTTKRRGWGLGLALAQRIIENYHQGKIFVKSSDANVGTTFRILLNG